MASYDELLDHYMRTMPPQVLALQGTPEFNDAFNKWTGDIMADLRVSDWSEIPVGDLGKYEYIGPGSPAATSTTGPAEQGIFNQISPGLVNQITGDAGRQQQVANLTAQTNAAYGNLGTVLGQTQTRFDGNAYLRANPDVAAAYQRDGNGMSVDDYAKRHYDTFGRNEGRASALTSDLLNAQRGNVDATVRTIVDASNTNAATATAALGRMTGDQIANLEKSMATQRAGLEQQVRELHGSAGEAAAARRAALERQIAELTAAQQPVSEARTRAAEQQVTGINLGLESTRDQISADAAREGFYGPSTMTDSNLARAAIDARQGAAQVGGAARVANAMDTRGIGNYGAGARYSIEDVLAGQRQQVSDFGSAGRAGLTAFGAETGRGIHDAGATGRFNIDTMAGRETQAARVGGAGQMSTYFDNLYPNAVNTAQLQAQLPGAQAAALTALIPYGTAGTRNALDTLNWFGSNTHNPPGPTPVITAPGQTGNQIGQLGASLVGAGYQVGSANNWWRTPTPKTTPGATFTPSPTTGGPLD